ncbi:B-box-type zinc finger [Artemisia annua]|uniref:B-box-type zinc finger n=1 Tax=Artemisia annua TaxID=35608 RepID=A0A2U1PU49_ARTAN|nr:B-box-type zinc finger [Artemisia annua]
MTKKCELCNHSAQIYCSSDTASLCYTCDQTVHSANFLVAKHSRTLLCHKCQSQTPWTASGLHLGRTVTVCVNCVGDDVAVSRNDVVPWSSDDVAPPCGSGGCESNDSSEDFRSGVKRCRFDDSSEFDYSFFAGNDEEEFPTVDRRGMLRYEVIMDVIRLDFTSQWKVLHG